MITRNADGTYTVVGAITCLSEAAALELLKELGQLSGLSMEATKPLRHQYGMRVVEDEVSRMPRVELLLNGAT